MDKGQAKQILVFHLGDKLTKSFDLSKDRNHDCSIDKQSSSTYGKLTKYPFSFFALLNIVIDNDSEE
jgi:hypothetical protein